MIISIIIATFNAERSVKKCLDCISPQKDEDIEVIIVDGGSTDKTVEYVKSYSWVDKLISEKDEGIYDAWNKGIKIANGRWIMFVGADDELLPNTLKKYSEFAKNIDKSVDIITAKSEYVDLKGKIIKIVGRPYEWDDYKKNMEISHGTTLHNRKLFDEIGLYDLNYKICSDYELLMRKGRHIKCVFYNKTILRFAIGGASFSFACQKETFQIRKKYHTISLLENYYLVIKRIVGLCIKKMLYTTK